MCQTAKHPLLFAQAFKRACRDYRYAYLKEWLSFEEPKQLGVWPVVPQSVRDDPGFLSQDPSSDITCGREGSFVSLKVSKCFRLVLMQEVNTGPTLAGYTHDPLSQLLFIWTYWTLNLLFSNPFTFIPFDCPMYLFAESQASIFSVVS